MIAETLRFMFPGVTFGPVGENAECVIVDDGRGPRIAEWRRIEKQPTMAEIEAVWPAVQAAMAQAAQEKQTADSQRQAGADEAKKAYARLQLIIDGASTATTAQMRAAIAEMARDLQHLIRAAVQ